MFLENRIQSLSFIKNQLNQRKKITKDHNLCHGFFFVENQTSLNFSDFSCCHFCEASEADLVESKLFEVDLDQYLKCRDVDNGMTKRNINKFEIRDNLTFKQVLN